MQLRVSHDEMYKLMRQSINKHAETSAPFLDALR